MSLDELMEHGEARMRWYVEMAIWRHTPFGSYPEPTRLDMAMLNRPMWPDYSLGEPVGFASSEE